MSRQTSIYVNGLLVIVLVSLIASYFAHSGSKASEIQPVFASERDLSDPTPQKTNKRNWRPVPLQKVFALDQLKNPGDVKVDREGNIYVLDWSDMRIRKFSEKGQLLGILGKGKGNNPGQFISPTDFTLTRNGEVLVADPKRKDITVFDSLGEVVKTISTKTPVMRQTV